VNNGRHISRWFWPCVVAIFVGSVTLGLLIGKGSLSNADLKDLFLTMRMQRVAVAFLAGAALAVGGVIAQGLFRNPLADPSILGTAAGASLGGQSVLLGTTILLHGRGPTAILPEMVTPLGCIAGASFALVIVLMVSARGASPITLVLSGFVLSSLFISCGSFLSSMAQENWELMRALSAFASGSVNGAGARQVILGAILVLGGALPAWLWSSSFDVLLSGEEEAASLGVNVNRVRLWAVIWASTITAGAVAVGANVGFVGLVVPHALRRFVGHTHRVMIPAAFITGGCYLVLCDVVCRAIPVRNEVSLAAITGLIGAPLFLIMLLRMHAESRYD